jgi:hypothetical protein
MVSDSGSRLIGGSFLDRIWHRRSDETPLGRRSRDTK